MSDTLDPARPMTGWQIDAAALRALREEALWTQSQIATQLGVHRTSWNRYENGEQPAERVVYDFLRVISDRLGRKVTIGDIATRRPVVSRRAA